MWPVTDGTVPGAAALAMRARLKRGGALGRIASRIRTEKTLNLLFEHARKTAE